MAGDAVFIRYYMDGDDLQLDHWGNANPSPKALFLALGTTNFIPKVPCPVNITVPNDVSGYTSGPASGSHGIILQAITNVNNWRAADPPSPWTWKFVRGVGRVPEYQPWDHIVSLDLSASSPRQQVTDFDTIAPGDVVILGVELQSNLYASSAKIVVATTRHISDVKITVGSRWQTEIVFPSSPTVVQAGTNRTIDFTYNCIREYDDINGVWLGCIEDAFSLAV